VLSPFQHALGNEPLVNGLSIGYAAAMLAVGLVLVMGSLPLFARRDIAV
jgi:branched-subunit amino acid ABC-type transport system permease component